MQLPARLDIGERLVPALGAAAAIYLIAVPVIMLLYAAFRGPPDYLPFETGERPPDWDELRDRALRLRAHLESRGQDPANVFARTEAAHPELTARELLGLLEDG